MEMIIGTTNLNNKINQSVFNKIIIDNYDIAKLSTTYDDNVQSPLRCYLKFMGTVGKNGKSRSPVIFVYSSGAINIMSQTKDKMLQAMDFIRELIDAPYYPFTLIQPRRLIASDLQNAFIGLIKQHLNDFITGKKGPEISI